MKTIFIIVQYVIVLIWVVSFGLYTRFSNPDMTDTRLFLTYWTIYVPNIVVFFISSFIMFREFKND